MLKKNEDGKIYLFFFTLRLGFAQDIHCLHFV